jgi:twinkle protein
MHEENPSIARIDAYRAKRVGEMLITREAEEAFQRDPNDVLLDLASLDGKELVEQNRTFEARYATAPFDPEGRMLRFYPGGVSIWSGFPGAGKTTLLRQFICHTLHRGSSVFLASLEEDPRRVIFKLAATAAGTLNPTAHQVQWFIDAYVKRFRLWGVIGIAQHLRLLGLVRELAAQQIHHAIFDSLMCLDVANDSTEGQRRFANLLATTARAAGIHIHLVAHPRKPQKAGAEIDLNEIAGAREIGGIADNVIFIRRDLDRKNYTANADVTPMCVSIKKQRHYNGALGDVEGWFQRPLRQFSSTQFIDAPVRYLPDDAYLPICAYTKEAS